MARTTKRPPAAGTAGRAASGASADRPEAGPEDAIGKPDDAEAPAKDETTAVSPAMAEPDTDRLERVSAVPTSDETRTLADAEGSAGETGDPGTETAAAPEGSDVGDPSDTPDLAGIGRKTIGPGEDAAGPDPRMRRDRPDDAERSEATRMPRVDPVPLPPVTEARHAASEPPADRRGPGFLPLVLGGLLAGAIGYAIPTWIAPPAGPAADTARIDAVEARLEELAAGSAGVGVDAAALDDVQVLLSGEIAALADRIAALEGRAAEAVDAGAEADLTAQFDALGGRLDSVAGDLDAAIGRLDRIEGETASATEEIAALSSRLDGIVSDLDGRMGALEAGLQDATARASSVEDEAQAMAREAARNQIRIALDSGAPYTEPLGVLGDAPADLAAPAAEGVATQAVLVAEFPPLAREALRVARAGTGQGGVGALLSSAFGARSLEPRDGTDADAVLSRAEAAARSGDLAGALAEIDALPEPARAVFDDWSARARERIAARAAADDFLMDG